MSCGVMQCCAACGHVDVVTRYWAMRTSRRSVHARLYMYTHGHRIREHLHTIREHLHTCMVHAYERVVHQSSLNLTQPIVCSRTSSLSSFSCLVGAVHDRVRLRRPRGKRRSRGSWPRSPRTLEAHTCTPDSRSENSPA